MEGNNIASPINSMFVGLKFEPSDALLMGLLYARISGMLYLGVGKGMWKGEDAGQPIIYSSLSKKPVGFRKRFRYEEGHGTAKRVGGGWIMHEYSLDSWLQKNEDGYVLCRLRKNLRDQKK
ncbi:hypothetical protein DITRI_Ditri08aG0078100 [Diplodiscus trichospermus]